MSKMNVAMYYNNSDVRIEQMPIPSIGDDEILVKVIACGICGSDVMEWYRIKKAPLVLGHELAGVVEKIGKNVKKFEVGDRVFVTHHVPCNTCRYCLKGEDTVCHTLHSTTFYPGGFAQYLRVPAINVDRGTIKLPDEMSFDEATFIEPLGCVVRGFRNARFKPTRSVLILGCGMAGLLHIKLAKALGASRIFATDVDGARLKMAKKLGADFVFHASEDVKQKIRENNDGCLADFVSLCAGVPSAVSQALECVEDGGSILWFAPTKPGESVSFPFFEVWNKQIYMCSTYAAAGKDLVEAIELIRSKRVMVEDMITHKLPLSEAQKGFSLAAKASDSMKVIIEPNK